MEFLDKLKSMSPLRQLVFAIGALIIVISVVASVYFVFLKQPQSVLFSDLRPQDAATIVSELEKKKVAYHLADGGSTILVAQDQVDSTRLSILSQDLPLKGTVGFELFNTADIGLTEFAQKINYQRALQGELARTIMAIDGIDMARVHLSLPEPTVFRDDKREPKASIALTFKSDKKIGAKSVLGIQRLVAAAIPDLSVSNVVVLDGEGQVISNDVVSVDFPLDADASESGAKRSVELYYEDKIRESLTSSFPSYKFVVNVEAAPSSVTHDISGDNQSSENLFKTWVPEERKFSLSVQISGVDFGNEGLLKDVRLAAAKAIDLNTEIGDDIFLSPIGEEQIQSPKQDISGASQSASNELSIFKTIPSLSKTPWFAIWVFVMSFAALVLFLAIRILEKMRLGSQEVAELEHQEFARRFQSLLDRGESDNAST